MLGVMNYNNNGDMKFFFEEGDLDELMLWDVAGVLIDFREKKKTNLCVEVSSTLRGLDFIFNPYESPASLILRGGLYRNIMCDCTDIVYRGDVQAEFIYLPDYNFPNLIEKVQYAMANDLRESLSSFQ
jgi:hypothetical protein